MSRTLPPDDQLHALHQQAVQALSPATLARLRSARHATAASPRRPAWWMATAFAGIAALGVGLSLQLRSPPSSVPAVAPMVAALESDGTALDENPDLYLWLASTDLAME
ncbi:hypothetical protein EDF77_0128 [Stenotrophomonas maltophilia]|uniref:hypothetical protein n=1 Tax=Stenotrophomonas chelatiphaga TaxID=517011 RepID=UPI000F4BF850|nr:hydrogenase/urease accessory protein HupE [Stenotrophomonas chelatiphaga]ROQ48591.1 hypothetical protein EDF77_0128 [Stenotrophomonas maltophilia]